MPFTRKLVRDAMKAALANPADGFNARIAAIADEYGIEPFTIDFGAGSLSFLETYADQPGRLSSRLIAGVSLFLYTSLSEQDSAKEKAKRAVFEGSVTAHLDFDVCFREGIGITEELTENYADAIEHAVTDVLLDAAAPNTEALFSGPVYFSGGFACAREPAVQTADGFRQLLPFTFLYEVHA